MVPERFSTFHFSQSNPRGEGQGDVPALLRRVAISVEELGDVTVHDLVLHTDLDEDGERRPSVTVYYDASPGP